VGPTDSAGEATGREAGQLRGPRFELRFPKLGEDEEVVQGEGEWFELRIGEETRRVRVHDYAQIYSVPGLYETLFYDYLGCESPRAVSTLLGEALGHAGVSPADLSVLDVGAGNGMMGEQLATLGVGRIFGVDIIEEAAQAQERDRPGVYHDYLVCDLTDLTPAQSHRLTSCQLNCMTTVAALGFADIPPAAFARAYNFISSPGWMAFNIKEDFMSEEDDTGFDRLIRRMAREGLFERQATRRYRHRYSLAGDPLYYLAVVGSKTADVPMSWVAEAR
jgi:hypothetical protein